MALLGINKQRAFGQLPPQMSPLQAYGDGSTPAMMQQPMQQPQQPEQPAKFKPNWLGVLGDAMQVFGGGQATYMQGVREQQERTDQMRQRAMERQQDRETSWQDHVRKETYKRENPEPGNPHYWEMNDGSLGRVGPDGKPEVVYKDPNKKPEYRQGADGRFYQIDVSTGPMPTFTDNDWNTGQPAGGPVQNAPATFPRR